VRLPAKPTLAVALTVAVVLMFRAYLTLARAYPMNADGAEQAWDMLHGNLLLHGWTVADVPFWSSDLPQYR
jgi:hypothetical protein